MMPGLLCRAIVLAAVGAISSGEILVAQPAPRAPGDSIQGEKLFRRICAQCHSLTDNRTGPRLGDFYGRTVASVQGYRYSNAVASLSFAWSDSTLDAWLAGPRDFVRGAAMGARLKDGQERLDVIAYLRTLRLD